MNEYIKKYGFEYIFALILIIIIAIAVTIKLGYVYSTNDDVMIKSIISGNLTGNPEKHVINIMYIAGVIGTFLYNIFPQVYWYDLFMVGLHYLCWYLFIVRMGQQCNGKKAKMIVMILATLLLLIVDLKYLVLHQYTILTTQLVSISIFWMLTSKVCRGPEYWIERVVILSTFVSAMWLRKEAFLLALPVFFIVVLYEIWMHKESKIIKPVCIYVSILLLFILSTYALEKVAYSDSEWAMFMRSHNARIQVYDYTGVPSRNDYIDEYEKMGIDEGDWMAIDTYNCELAKDFNAAKMEGIAEISIQNQKSWREVSNNVDLIKKSMYKVCASLYDNQIHPISFFLICAYLSAFLLCYKEDDKKSCILCGTILLFFAAVYVWLINRGRVPERVIYGICFIQLSCLCAVITKNVKKLFCQIKKDKFWFGVMTLISMVIFGVSFIYSWQSIKEERDVLLQKADDWELVNEYFAQNTQNIYCIDTNSFSFSTEKMFSEKIESDNMIRMGGWILNSPLQEKRLENQGVDNLVEQLAYLDNYYIVQEEMKDTLWIETIWEENGYPVKATTVDTIVTPNGRTFEVIQLK